MSIMIVTNNDLLKILADVLNRIGYGVIVSSQEDALLTFLEKEPSSVLVFEEWTEKGDLGAETYSDLKNSATDDIRVFRVSFDDDSDIKMPFDHDELLSKLGPIAKEELS